MDESTTKEKPDTDNLSQRRRDIERLWLEGLTTHEIADALGLDPRSVGQNLRALRNRRKRAAARQQEVVTMTQCATIFREAMEGWERSQKPKCTKTEERKDGKLIKTVTREVQGPGDKGFLVAALNALKTLRQFAPEKPPKSSEQVDIELVEILNILTPEQVERFTHAQLTRCRKAVDRRMVKEGVCEPTVEAEREAELGRQPTVDVPSEPVPDCEHVSEPARNTEPDCRCTVEAGREQEAESEKNDLRTFTLHTKPTCRAKWRHKTLVKMLDRVATGDFRRRIVFLPPQHGKSERESRRFHVRRRRRSPNLRLIAASHIRELAVDTNRDVCHPKWWWLC